MRTILCWLGGAVIGAAVTAFLLADRSQVASAAPATVIVPRASDPAPGPLVLVDERNLRVVYANGYRIHTSPEEVIIDLGLTMANPTRKEGDPEMLFAVSDRVVLTYFNAKKLSLSLNELIRKYERQYGDLPSEPNARKTK